MVNYSSKSNVGCTLKTDIFFFFFDQEISGKLEAIFEKKTRFLRSKIWKGFATPKISLK